MLEPGMREDPVHTPEYVRQMAYLLVLATLIRTQCQS
jgi:hypothetical protein